MRICCSYTSVENLLQQTTALVLSTCRIMSDLYSPPPALFTFYNVHKTFFDKDENIITSVRSPVCGVYWYRGQNQQKCLIND